MYKIAQKALADTLDIFATSLFDYIYIYIHRNLRQKPIYNRVLVEDLFVLEIEPT